LRVQGQLADAHAPANDLQQTPYGKLPHTRVRDGSLAPANGIHPHTRVRDGSLASDAQAKRYTHIRACAMNHSRKLFRLFSRHIS
jgi:hypothetical protein